MQFYYNIRLNYGIASQYIHLDQSIRNVGKERTKMEILVVILLV